LLSRRGQRVDGVGAVESKRWVGSGDSEWCGCLAFDLSHPGWGRRVGGDWWQCGWLVATASDADDDREWLQARRQGLEFGFGLVRMER